MYDFSKYSIVQFCFDLETTNRKFIGFLMAFIDSFYCTEHLICVEQHFVDVVKQIQWQITVRIHIAGR